jgi:hypothetical protein
MCIAEAGLSILIMVLGMGLFRCNSVSCIGAIWHFLSLGDKKTPRQISWGASTNYMYYSLYTEKIDKKTKLRISTPELIKLKRIFTVQAAAIR